MIEKDAKDLTQGDMKYVAACIAYTEGVVQGALATVAFENQATGKDHPSPFCIPEEGDNGQMIRIALKYIRNHPQESHKGTVVLIIEALHEALPCPVSQPKR